MATHDDSESTSSLLVSVRNGDEAARTRLVARYLFILRRWAHGRLPSGARRHADTDDIVQTTLIRALNGVATFEPRREGAFLAYLRTILMNEIRGAARRGARGQAQEALPDDLPDDRPSPLAEAIGVEAVERYEAALGSLTEEQREACVLRIEMGLQYREIADAMGAPSPDAARMLVARALTRLTRLMAAHDR